ncbi:MAG: M3 family metallopeptidase [Bradyrhizobiaceae bacterium]|nr:M3 family metallopeptidase [Bradyrhizobiaceae bacterium]
MTGECRVAQQNPLLQSWTTPFGAPPFETIRPEHFMPAFEQAIAEHKTEIEAIAVSKDAPTLSNTIDAMELSGRRLRDVSAVFYSLAGSHTNDALQKVEREIAPIMARHRDSILLNEALFVRIRDLHQQRDTLGLSEEQARVLDRYHTRFVRNGANLAPEQKQRLAAINERLATLGTQFSQNVLADEKSYQLVLETEDDLAGLPDSLRAAAAEAAKERGLAGKHVITLARSSIEPFLQFSKRRDLRETAWRAWVSRGEHAGSTDNRPVAAEMVALRAERAQLLGYENFAAYRLDDTMAKTPQAALDLLHSVWTPAVEKAGREQAALQEIIRSEGGNFETAAWDWRHYAEKRRKAEFDLDESEIKPYLQLDRMIEAAFDTAGRLFGLRFTPRPDVPVYHPDVRAWEVTDAAGKHVGLFYGDYFARSSKRSGAWMSGFRSQEKLAGDIRPIIVNVMNFAKAAEGPSLLSFDDARTLFHEFGHGLHGLLSDVTYPLLSGTSVSADFVELPSQLLEHWLERPEVLRRHAVHSQTGKPMPDALIERVLKSTKFNQGFASVEYVSSALVDLDLHAAKAGERVDLTGFEKASLDRIGMPEAIVMRHRLPHFSHLFAGDHYAAGYYSYLWAEVLAADAFHAFEEKGDIFDPETAKKLREFVLSAGYVRDPAMAYRRFRGRDAAPEPLLRRRGLLEAPVADA